MEKLFEKKESLNEVMVFKTESEKFTDFISANFSEFDLHGTDGSCGSDGEGDDNCMCMCDCAV